MKRVLLFTALLLSITTVTLLQHADAQVPEKMSYQAVVRDGSNNLVTNTPVGMQISILQGSTSGMAVYEEIQTPSTNANGLASIEIGGGTVVSGSFSSINWANGPYFIKTETDPTGGTTYTITGINQLLSVPYAMHAKTAENAANVQITGNETVFDAWDKDTTNDFSGNFNNLANRPEITTTPNILIGPGAGQNTSGDRHAIAIGDSALYNNGEGATESYEATGNTAVGSKALYSNTKGYYNTANGYQALLTNTTGRYNTANGYRALYSNISATFNTAIGYQALCSNTITCMNTAIGSQALFYNRGSINTANGSSALYHNTTGSYNTGNGSRALYSNTTGHFNTANGDDALFSNTTGYSNVAMGVQTLHGNTTKSNLVAMGDSALYNNGLNAAFYYHATGNTAIGSKSLYSNTNGYYNTAHGYQALYTNTTGARNTANGYQALYSTETGEANTANGYQALYNATEGSSNTAIGYQAGYDISTGFNNIAVGYNAQVLSPTGSNQVRMGSTEISYAAIQVPWSITSDIRWKESIRDLPYGLAFVNNLRPVDYIRKNNENNTREAGFIAQDVEALLSEMGIENSGIISKGCDGLLELRYNDFISLLTKALQEQQVIIEELKARIEALENK